MRVLSLRLKAMVAGIAGILAFATLAPQDALAGHRHHRSHNGAVAAAVALGVIGTAAVIAASHRSRGYGYDTYDAGYPVASGGYYGGTTYVDPYATYAPYRTRYYQPYYVAPRHVVRQPRYIYQPRYYSYQPRHVYRPHDGHRYNYPVRQRY
jgi:hypothetical protein